eukprot:NODE_20899_length_777_cov_2.238462.p1 GENE.NODE_20899_length_777_cov_2.238462~~NODE_20899_length_777_cov_2.238462.p1  ORF type:complete len:189 (-),score=53.91 NODE_20899_length_777_cov_2.238462:70-636(-)
MSGIVTRWWTLLKQEHSGVSLLFTPSHGVAFNRHERAIIFGLGISSTWIMLNFNNWVHGVNQMVLGDMSGRSKKSLAKRILDGAVCFVAGATFEFFAGKTLAVQIIQSSWNEEGGMKRFVSLWADYWALFLSWVGILHLQRHTMKHPEGVKSPFILDWLESCAIGVVLVEPAQLLFKAIAQHWSARSA